jgi:hypothetical protein
LVVVVSSSMASSVAHAQNKAAAAAAFDKGKALMDAGKPEEACPEFERSQELDPQFGTQYNLALCYQELGRLASAYGEFDELAGKDTNVKRKKKSKEYAKALKPRLTRLTLVVSDPAPDLVVKRDGVDITLLVGVTTPVDPGEFTFEASAPGRTTWSQKVDLTAEGATITVEIPPLSPETPGDDGDGDDGDDDDEGRAIGGPGGTATPGGGSPGKTRKLLGIVGGAAGLVAIGVGGYFGIDAMSERDDAVETCGGQLDPCYGDFFDAQNDIDEARSSAMLSNIFIGAGVALVAAGAVLYLTAPSGESSDRTATIVPVVGADGAGVVLDGSF